MNKFSSIRDEYFAWLQDLLDINRPDRSYFLLIKALHHKYFTWFVPNDDNRATEGMELRVKFCEEMGWKYRYEEYQEACSMLELIVALSFRCEAIMEDQGERMKMNDWFWKILGNVGLDKFTDVEFYDEWEGGDVDDILDRVIQRTYKRDGRGGLFPLKRPKKDQTKVELWYQMNTYLVENYYTDVEVV